MQDLVRLWGFIRGSALLRLDKRLQCLSLRIHPHVGIMLQHLGDVPGDVANHFIRSAALSKIRDHGVAIVMPAALDVRFRSNILPGRLERYDRPRGIVRRRLAEGEQVPFRPGLAEFLRVPLRVSYQRLQER